MKIATRIAAGLAGALLLAVGAYATVGGILVVPAGMLVALLIARRRHLPLTRRATWFAACIGVAVWFVGGAAALAMQVPDDTWSKFRQAADSAVAAPTAPPPAWLERIAPGTSAAAASDTTTTAVERVIAVWAGVTGLAIGIALIAMLLGTIGWLASRAIVFGAIGR